MTSNYNSVSEYAELCSAAKAAGCRCLSRISTSAPLAYLPVLPVTCRPDPGLLGCGVLQRHVAVYPVGLFRQAQQGTGASRIEEPVRGASHSRRPPVEHVRVDLCRADIPVPEELLNGADVVPVLEEMRRERVA